MRVLPLCSFAIVSLSIPTVVLAGPLALRHAQDGGFASVRPLRVLVTPAPAAPRPSCDACSNWRDCEDALHRAGASVQVVALKNGLMRIYTADTPARVRLVQALISRRDDYLRSLDGAGETARLCPACRTVRGAALSGKLVRQVVPVESGCITIITSTDPGMVTKIRAQAPAGPVARSQAIPALPARPRN